MKCIMERFFKSLMTLFGATWPMSCACAFFFFTAVATSLGVIEESI